MRRRIVALVVAMTTLVVLAFAIPLAVLIRHNVYSDAVKALQDSANSVAYDLRTPDAVLTSAAITTYLDGRSDSAGTVTVQLPDGKIVGQEPPGGLDDAPAVADQGDEHGRDHFPGGPDVGGGGPAGPQVTTWHGGKIVQVPVGVPNGGQYIVRAYATDDKLHSGETRWWLLLVATSVGLLVIGVGAAELLTRRIVRPLVRTAETAQQLATGDVTARAPTEGPREIAEVGVALNSLADRIDELIAEERETVADMSHRLRTPLTALRLDAEALRDPADAERIGNHVGALERMLTSVIRAARRPQREGRMPSCDAAAVVGERVAFWSALAEDQGRASSIAVPREPVPVRAAAEDLAAAVDALIENVVAHTPEGTAFAVSLTPADGGAVLVVSDEGPGLPADASVRGRSDRGSTGLGLDIARRCAEASGGSITFAATASGGAEVTLRLGRP